MLPERRKLQLESQEGLQKGKQDRAETLPLCPKPRPTILGLLCHQGMIPAARAMDSGHLAHFVGPTVVAINHRGAPCSICRSGITLDTLDAYQDRVPHLYDALVREPEPISSPLEVLALLGHVRSLAICTAIVQAAVRGGRRSYAAGRQRKVGLGGCRWGL